MNKKYTKPLFAAVISLSLMASTAQANFAGKAASFAYNGTSVAGSALLAWVLKDGIKNHWNTKTGAGRSYKGLFMYGLYYTALSKAFFSGAKSLVNTFKADSEDDGMDEDSE